MRNPSARSARAVRRRGLLMLSLAALVAPTQSASAQLGKLVRKARDRAVEQQVEKQIDRRTGATSSAVGAPPTFDDVTVELTADRVEQIIRGLEAGRALLEGANGEPSRAELIGRRDAAYDRRSKLSDANAKLIAAYEEKRDEAERCRNDAIGAARDRRSRSAEARNKEMGSKAMTDPVFREKAMAIAQKMAVAQQRGDTAELRRLGAELGLAPDDPQADSVAADRACGPVPPRPAVLAQMEQLDAEGNSLGDRIRKLEESSAATEVEQSGLDEQQFFVARERIEAYLTAVKYQRQPSGFSPREMEALGARRSRLEQAM